MADEALQDSFATTGWQLFDDTADADINVYTDSVVGYISKCIDDVVPKISICTQPKQKPWIGPEIWAKFKTATIAFNSGDTKACKTAKYELRKSIGCAKRDYREKGGVYLPQR